jgi:hypothetical protein
MLLFQCVDIQAPVKERLLRLPLFLQAVETTTQKPQSIADSCESAALLAGANGITLVI